MTTLHPMLPDSDKGWDEDAFVTRFYLDESRVARGAGGSLGTSAHLSNLLT